jgi:hypothetical protein
MTMVVVSMKMMKLQLWPEQKVEALTWRVEVNLGVPEMAPKLMPTPRELRCERVCFNALGLLLYQDILARSGLRIFCKMEWSLIYTLHDVGV